MKPQPNLKTDRLILRPFELSDAKEVQEKAGDKEIADTTLNIPHPYPDGAAEEWISTHKPKFEAGELANFAITLKESGELIGSVGLTIKPKFKRAELGYWIAKEHWGKGYATEAAKAAVSYGFKKLGLNKVIANHMVENPASGRVMEKLGMTKVGLFKKHVLKGKNYQDLVYYEVLKKNFHSEY